jgi:pimeloyl-ACP methyl ester carboxylesterase
MTGATPQTLDLADHRVALVDRPPLTPPPPGAGGAGPLPLVLLHGGAADHRMWTPQLGAFPDRRLVVPDARGHGGSSDADAPYRLCDDLVVLLDALGIERAVLVGVSMGGGTAVDTALEHPSRVAGLVVSGTATSEPEFTDPWALEAFAEWRAAEQAGDPERWVAAYLRFVPGPHRGADEVDPAVLELVERMAVDTLAAHVRLDEHGVPQPPHPVTPVRGTWERLPGIAVPAVAVVGALDGDDHVRMGERFAAAVPGAVLVRVEGSAHYPNLERPAQFDAAVQDLLDRHGL